MISALLWVPHNLQRAEPRRRSSCRTGVPLANGSTRGIQTWPRSCRMATFCIAPNVRGSTGYGMDFQRANYKDLGGGDLQDEVYATKFLVATGYVDPKRVGITGGSYGGFMTLMAIGKVPDIWAAAVEEYGIINWSTMVHRSDPGLQQYIIGLLGDPEKDKKVYDATSPITFVHDCEGATTRPAGRQ